MGRRTATFQAIQGPGTPQPQAPQAPIPSHQAPSPYEQAPPRPQHGHHAPQQRAPGRVQADTLPPVGDSFQDQTRPIEPLSADLLLQGLEEPSASQSGAWAAEHVSRSFTIPVAAVQAPPQTSTEAKRVTYGIWGAAIGAILGILLGVVNALFEGTSVDAGIRPLFTYALFLMIAIGGAAAYAPHVFDDLFERFGLRTS